MLNTSSNGSIIKYKALSLSLEFLSAPGGAVYRRPYTGGYTGTGGYTALLPTPGASVASYYSTFKFLPGTAARWEPSISPTLGGRLYVGFTDNPEVCVQINSLYNTYATTPTTTNYNNYAATVKSLGDVISFPAWQEQDITIPMRLRRKRFQVNSDMANLETTSTTDISVQTFMFVCADGLAATSNTTLGSFWFHDVLDVEGLHALPT